MQGRKRKSIEQRRREGNPGNRPLPQALELDPSPPARPDYLPPAAAALWDELVPALADVGVAQRVDAPALAALCIQWARAEQARRILAAEGDHLLVYGSKGQFVEHPALAIERSAHALFLRFAEHYGLTAAARARIAATAVVARAVKAHLDAELSDVIDMTPELRAVE